MLIDSIAAFLAVSLLFYCLLAGADFGAGILECVRGRTLRAEQTELITHAMGPVWEANHVWLVLAVVILFNGFPSAFARLCVLYHLPLTLLLIGVILRGCAFTFRHYDAVKDGSQRIYDGVFRVASVLSSVTIGTVAGAILLAQPVAPGFFGTYISPWLNAFALLVGIFTAVLFAFLAAVYLIGEAETPELRKLFARRARILNGLAVLVGGLVFGAAEVQGLPLLRRFLDNGPSLVAMGLATFILLPLWLSLKNHAVATSRGLAAAQMALILAGWFAIQFPVLLGHEGTPLTIYRAAACPPVLGALLGALLVGSALIFPALFLLLRIFKQKR